MRITDVALKENGDYPTGGLAHSHETLGEFMGDLNDMEKNTLEQINCSLEACGLLPINETNYPEVKSIPNYHVMIHDFVRINMD